MNRKIYRKTKAQKRKTLLKGLALLLISLLICFSAYGIYLVKKAQSAVDTAYESAGNANEHVEPLTDNISILFIGVDDSAERGQSDNNIRSDALILATLNNKDKSIKLVSIPRDTYTYIPDKGREDKITHAYALNGPSSTIESVEQLLEVPVDYYLRMNFDAFIEVVDALGGIKAEVPYDITEQDENDSQNAIELKEGIQFLNGSEALALARTRHYDNDIERGKRQQMILESIMNRALSVGSISKYGDVFEAVGDNMKTDLSFGNISALFEYAKNGKPDIETITLDGYDDMSTGIYYWKLKEESLEELQDVLQSHLGLKSDTSHLTQKEADILPSTYEKTSQ